MLCYFSARAQPCAANGPRRNPRAPGERIASPTWECPITQHCRRGTGPRACAACHMRGKESGGDGGEGEKRHSAAQSMLLACLSCRTARPMRCCALLAMSLVGVEASTPRMSSRAMRYL